ncbi:hypothetical protein WJ0W_005595 [Paenibacillus melissococcoides]|uniref:DUF2500 domain-containing protein n=1 Tax=Paenibacillus melissococcoides TaxID=2912268 RepID=A0ABN8UDS6_9BACL|nr:MULTISPECIES: hypothetical protein [Paenibacillus]MEB9896616.1 hypothetical protein [Bacillus cereus]CAH8248338.1 hypothetical protein WJ0W_005595 [Paenibacillus melissococcoides]CAH8717784.1 hypothetical protein HTL2_005057 [Paenibacillus melissococcoides]CAH8719337.1 hypothetical protein WDD9_005515 [Paenibacillus melissococcoides]GIO77139.1 hypothetical protein J6TS7_07490 [Paenibacillus dendritiformis]
MENTTLWIIIGILVIDIIIVLCVVSSIVRKKKRARQQEHEVMTRGILASATIMSLSPTTTRIDDQPVVLLALDVAMPNGDSFPIEIKTAVHMLHIPKFQEGAQISVKVLEEHGTKRVVVLGTGMKTY